MYLMTEQVQSTDMTQGLSQAAINLIIEAKASNSIKMYTVHWKAFMEFCTSRKMNALHSGAVVEFLAHYYNEETKRAPNGRSYSTMQQALSAIRYALELSKQSVNHLRTIEVRDCMEGIRRNNANQPERNIKYGQKLPITIDELKRMVDTCDNSIMGTRDKAILLLWFFSALRRSNIVDLQIYDIESFDEGITVFIRKSKTDQRAKGKKIAVLCYSHSEYCPVLALQNWINKARIIQGPLFRRLYKGDKVADTGLDQTGRFIAKLVKKYCRRAGIAFVDSIAAHSGRSGCITAMARNNAPMYKMCEVTTHSSYTSLKTYTKDRNLFDNHAAVGLL